MADLTKEVSPKAKDGELLSLKMGVVKIFAGAAVGLIKGTGYAVKIASNNPPMRFVGVAAETKDNSAGAAGDKNIIVKRKGIFCFNQSGLAVTDIGKNAYFSDDNTVTTTANNKYAGRIIQLDDDGAWVDIEPALQNVRLRQISFQPSPLAAAGTTREARYRVPAGCVAYLQAASYGYSVKPVWATSCVLLLQKLAATVRTTLLVAASLDVNNVAPAVDTPTALSLTATLASLAMAAGDELEAALTAVGALTAAGDPHVHCEILEIGGTND